MKIHTNSKRKSGIRISLIRLVSLLVILPLCSMIVFLSMQMSSYLTRKTVQDNETFITQIATNADQFIEVINYATSMLMVNQDTLHHLRTINTSKEGYTHYQARDALSKQLTDIESSIMNAVNGKIAVLTTSGYLISSFNISRADKDYSQEQWYLDTLENGRKVTFNPSLSEIFREVYVDNQFADHQYLYYARTIKSYSGNDLGIVLTQISTNKIWGSYLAKHPGNIALYLLNTDGELQALSGKPDDLRYQTLECLPELLSLEKEKTIHGTSENGHFYSAVRLENAPYILIFTQPANELFLANKTITNSLWFATVVITILILCILVYLSKRITQPLSTLIKTMDEHQNGPIPQQNIDTSFHELDNFVESYNQAWQRVSLLMDRVREETHLREKAYYDLLISQISPHFICNTVNSIKYLAAEEGGSASVDALDALSEILQSVYDNTSDLTIIAKELHLLSAYVRIMRMRFGFDISYIENIPAELFMCEIPAFTLQPLVENAFLHGVHEKQAGQIILNADAMENEIQISVFNNGNDADLEKVRCALAGNIRNRSQFTGFGLYNINSRLKTLYGEQYGLSLNENLQSGFEILVRIPRKEVQLSD